MAMLGGLDDEPVGTEEEAIDSSLEYLESCLEDGDLNDKQEERIKAMAHKIIHIRDKDWVI